MGGHGPEQKYNGIISYGLSPYEQRAFPRGFIADGISNSIRRFRGQYLRVLPPFIIGYLIWDWGESQYRLSLRKNPKDYENDQ